MKNLLSALVLAAMIGAPLAAYAGEGPRPSSLNNWPGMTDATAPASVPAISPFDGSRPSSLNNWPGITGYVNPASVSSADPSFQGPRPSPNH